MKLYIFSRSPNARKTMTVNSLLGLGLETVEVDLMAGEHKRPEFLALNPNGKIPVLQFDDGSTLWESNAIINRLASEAESDIWPGSDQRYDIVRWQFWEACHWSPACAKFISRHLFGNESIDMEAAAADFDLYAKVLDTHLAQNDWLSGDGMSTADISAGAMLCYREPCHYPLAGYGNIARWIGRLEALPAWREANT